MHLPADGPHDPADGGTSRSVCPRSGRKWVAGLTANDAGEGLGGAHGDLRTGPDGLGDRPAGRNADAVSEPSGSLLIFRLFGWCECVCGREVWIIV